MKNIAESNQPCVDSIIEIVININAEQGVRLTDNRQRWRQAAKKSHNPWSSLI